MNRNEDLPDLGELIDTLDQDAPQTPFDDLLNREAEPAIPSLFADHDQIENYGNIYKLTQVSFLVHTIIYKIISFLIRTIILEDPC